MSHSNLDGNLTGRKRLLPLIQEYFLRTFGNFLKATSQSLLKNVYPNSIITSIILVN